MIAGPVVLDTRTASPHFPGIGRAVTGLARALAVRADSPPVVLLHNAVPDERLPLAVLRGITCTASPFAPRQQWEVRQLLRAAGACLYHSPYYLMPFAPGVRTVVTCYDLIPLTVRGLFGPARRAAFWVAHALAFRAAAAIVVPSEATRRDVSRLFPTHASKVEVIPIGWRFADAPDADEARRLRTRLGITGPYVLSVGSNKPHKNLRTLLDAWARRVDQRRGGNTGCCSLVIAGPRDARYTGHLPQTRRLRDSGHLIDTGPVSDSMLSALYQGATLFIFPSVAEGFGLPVIEAMGHGVPVVCSRIPALTELAGDAAAMFPPTDVDRLSTLVDHLLDATADLEKMRENGLARAAAFEWDRVAAATSMLYDRVLREHP